MMSDQLAKRADEVSTVLKQLAHPAKLKLLCNLLESERTVSEIVVYVGEAQSWVSQMLSRMKLEGLVESRKEGSFVYYRIADPRLRDLMRAVHRIYCPPQNGRSSAKS